MKKTKEIKSLAKWNLGQQECEGFTRVKFDPLKFPWPLKSESAEEIISPMQINYVPAGMRGQYMDEIYRVLVDDGKVHIWAPYYSSMRAIQDYAAEWPPICEASFLYFNREWRKLNHPDRTLKCNFADLTFGYQAAPDTANKNDETRTFWITHYTNSVLDIRAVMTKKP